MFRLNHSIQGQIKNVLHIFNWTLEANLVHTNLFISFIYHYNSNRFALKSSKALLLFLFSQFVLKHALTLYFSSKFKANLFHFSYSSNEIRKTQNEHLISICQNLIGLYTFGDFRNIATNCSNLQFLKMIFPLHQLKPKTKTQNNIVIFGFFHKKIILLFWLFLK